MQKAHRDNSMGFGVFPNIQEVYLCQQPARRRVNRLPESIQLQTQGIQSLAALVLTLIVTEYRFAFIILGWNSKNLQGTYKIRQSISLFDEQV